MRNQMNNMEKLLPLFQQRCENEASIQSRKAVVAADETFFGDFLILVLMDLSSGYLILEDNTTKRPCKQCRKTRQRTMIRYVSKLFRVKKLVPKFKKR